MVSYKLFAFAQILSICTIGFVRLMDDHRPISWSFYILVESINKFMHCVLFLPQFDFDMLYRFSGKVYFFKVFNVSLGLGLA